MVLCRVDHARRTHPLSRLGKPRLMQGLADAGVDIPRYHAQGMAHHQRQLGLRIAFRANV